MFFVNAIERITKLCQICLRTNGGHFYHHFRKSVFPFSHNVIDVFVTWFLYVDMPCILKTKECKNFANGIFILVLHCRGNSNPLFLIVSDILYKSVQIETLCRISLKISNATMNKKWKRSIKTLLF